ncbi:transporter substrate-binding domain-containing protein [Leeia sp. TBRC 13508]|uniref:Transporter substrate-binding domain-containing protein n=1 Tax=Leeia speluncae TaxID=2884804 RepID=A0ABS8D8I1_9NEIS|nr:transporter substrate-binding domain-containing protein [Leeia speluncae]MCB6184437.1 transporter substrate-binding domain-containing protein [Leeia speluncae]
MKFLIKASISLSLTVALPVWAERIIVATTQNNPPYSFVTNGKPDGFNIALIRLLCADLKSECDLKLVDPIQIQNLVSKNQAAFGVASIRKNEVQPQNLPTEVYGNVKGGFVTAGKTVYPAFLSYDFLAGKRVGYVSNSAFEKLVKKNFPSATSWGYLNSGVMFNALKDQLIDLAIDDLGVINDEVSRRNGSFTVVGSPIVERRVLGDGYVIVLNKQNEKMRQQLNQVIKTRIADGSINQISLNYLGFKLF